MEHYKNFDYSNDDFLNFISKNLLIEEQNRTMELIYDQDPTSENILCMINYGHNNDYRSFIHIDKKRTMKAFFAHTNFLNASESEKTSLEAVKASFENVNQQLLEMSTTVLENQPIDKNDEKEESESKKRKFR
jgi:hypothetical protein